MTSDSEEGLADAIPQRTILAQEDPKRAE